MSNKARNTSGKFAAKSETPRKIRSVNLTDDAWQWLADVAAQAGVSRNDYIEAMAEGSIPFMETVSSEASPLMETVESDNAEIAEQQQDNISPLIETVNPEVESLKQRLEEVEAQLKELQENPETDFDCAGKAGKLVSWLRKEVGRALPKQVTVKTVQKILESGDN